MGVGVMGALSALIVSACVAPPLIAALTVISQTGDVVRGGAALFVMSLGMGTPLLLVGASAGKLLPRAGAWMDLVKNLFGVLFLAVAAWMLSRIVPAWAVLLLWAVPAFVLAWVLWRASFRSSGARNVSRVLGAARRITALRSWWVCRWRHQSLAPIRSLRNKDTCSSSASRPSRDLQREVAAASAAGKTVMVDFYADGVCRARDGHKTFTVPDVHAACRNRAAAGGRHRKR